MSVYLQVVQNSADYEIREQMSIGVFCLCCVNFLLKCLTVTYSLLVHDYKQQKDLYKISSLVLHTLKNCFKIHRGGNEAYTKPHTKCWMAAWSQSSKASRAIYKPEEKQRLTLLYNCPKIHRVEIEANWFD